MIEVNYVTKKFRYGNTISINGTITGIDSTEGYRFVVDEAEVVPTFTELEAGYAFEAETVDTFTASVEITLIDIDDQTVDEVTFMPLGDPIANIEAITVTKDGIATLSVTNILSGDVLIESASEVTRGELVGFDNSTAIISITGLVDGSDTVTITDEDGASCAVYCEVVDIDAFENVTPARTSTGYNSNLAGRQYLINENLRTIHTIESIVNTNVNSVRTLTQALSTAILIEGGVSLVSMIATILIISKKLEKSIGRNIRI